MNLEITKEQLLTTVYDNIDELVKPLSYVLIETGWEDVMAGNFLKEPNFIEEFCEIINEKNLSAEFIKTLQNLED